MTHQEYEVGQGDASLAGMSVWAKLEWEAPVRQGRATIVLSRAPDSDPVSAADVDAKLVDKDGVYSRVVERPSGLLVEAGGSLGTSANAVYRFEGGKAEPAELIVSYRDQSVHLPLVRKR